MGEMVGVILGTPGFLSLPWLKKLQADTSTNAKALGRGLGGNAPEIRNFHRRLRKRCGVFSGTFSWPEIRGVFWTLNVEWLVGFPFVSIEDFKKEELG